MKPKLNINSERNGKLLIHDKNHSDVLFVRDGKVFSRENSFFDLLNGMFLNAELKDVCEKKKWNIWFQEEGT